MVQKWGGSIPPPFSNKYIMSEINLTNIGQFIQGNSRMLANKLNSKLKFKFLELPDFIKEQIHYRESKCLDCAKAGECVHCGCSVPNKWFADKACKGKRWPDMMLKKEEWEAYKKQNNIEIVLNDIHNSKQHTTNNT